MALATKTIVLPVSGREAVVRKADANADNFLWQGKDRLWETLPRFWAMCTECIGEVTDPDLMEEAILGLYVPDQEFLAIEIYRVRRPDDKLVLSSLCSNPKCNEPLNHEVNLKKLEENQIPVPPGLTGCPDPTWEFVLPELGHTIVYRYRTGKQEQELNMRGKSDLLLPVFDAIVSVNGKKPRLSEMGSWPGDDVADLRMDMAEKRCGYDPTVRLGHKDCGSSEVVNLLMDPSFLFPGVLGRKRAILQPASG